MPLLRMLLSHLHAVAAAAAAVVVAAAVDVAAVAQDPDLIDGGVGRSELLLRVRRGNAAST